MRIARIASIALLGFAMIFSAACSSGSEQEPTPTPAASVTQQPTVTPTATTPAAASVTVSIDAPETVKKSSGRYFHAYVAITPIDDFFIAQYDISYDPDVIRVQDVRVGDISGTATRIEEWGYVPANTQGTLRIFNTVPASAGADSISGEGYLADIYFKIMGDPGDSSTISFVEGLGDPAGHLTIVNTQILEITTTWVDASVTIE